MNIAARYNKPGHVPHTGIIVGSSPVARGVLFMQLEDGSILAVDGYYVTAV
jgi:hypothetical protein